MSLSNAITHHTYTLTALGTWAQKTPYFPIKLLPKPLAEYLLDFISTSERGAFRQVCHQFKSYSSFSQKQLVKGISEGSIRVDCSIKMVMRKLFCKSPEKPIAMSPKYCFPEDSHMVLRTGKWVDVSQVEFDLSEIVSDPIKGDLFRNSLGASLLAQAMLSIGDKDSVSNLPICVEWNRPFPFDDSDRIVTVFERKISKISKMIQKKLDAHFSTIHFVVRDYYQVYLISIHVVNKKAVMTIFDSVNHSYEEEYLTTFVGKVKELLPESLPLSDERPSVRCLLLQEAPHLNGYCILYTALLLTHNYGNGVLDAYLNRPIFEGEYYNLDFCADLVVRSLLDCWHIECAKDWEKHLGDHFSEESMRIRSSGMSDGVFLRAPKQFRTIIAQLNKKSER